jgi:hypothetical protein
MTFITYPASCNGSDPTIVLQRKCYIPISALIVYPFSIEWGSAINAQVSASNIVGPSLFSGTTVSGAIILTFPDTPQNLVYDALQSSGSYITLLWN